MEKPVNVKKGIGEREKVEYSSGLEGQLDSLPLPYSFLLSLSFFPSFSDSLEWLYLCSLTFTRVQDNLYPGRQLLFQLSYKRVRISMVCDLITEMGFIIVMQKRLHFVIYNGIYAISIERCALLMTATYSTSRNHSRTCS